MNTGKLHYFHSKDEKGIFFSDDGKRSRDGTLCQNNRLVEEICSPVCIENTSFSHQILLSPHFSIVLEPLQVSQIVTDTYNSAAQIAPSFPMPGVATKSEENPTSNDRSIRALIAYADNEADNNHALNLWYRSRIDQALSTVSRQKRRKIEPTKHEIAKQKVWEYGDELETAHLILLLLDPNFVDTDYCYCKRLQAAVSRHYGELTRILPIYLRQCSLDDVPFRDLAFFPSSVCAVNQQNEDAAFNSITRGIREAVDWLVDNLKIFRSQ